MERFEGGTFFHDVARGDEIANTMHMEVGPSLVRWRIGGPHGIRPDSMVIESTDPGKVRYAQSIMTAFRIESYKHRRIVSRFKPARRRTAPRRRRCPECDGIGEIQRGDGSWLECPACGGRGR